MRVEQLPDVDLDSVALRLDDVRRRTLALVAVLDWDTLRAQHIPILSPMVWDLGHIGNFEEQWIGQRLAGLPPVSDGYQRMFDPVANPRPTRKDLPLPSGAQLLDYLARVREQTTRVLANGADGGDPRLVADGYVYEMVAEHEEQHQETLLQAMQVIERPPYVPEQRRDPLPPSAQATPGEMVDIPGGSFRMGWQRPGFAYDNELPPHDVQVPSFAIGRYPVTHGEYLAFIRDRGYQRRELWQDAG